MDTDMNADTGTLLDPVAALEAMLDAADPDAAGEIADMLTTGELFADDSLDADGVDDVDEDNAPVSVACRERVGGWLRTRVRERLQAGERGAVRKGYSDGMVVGHDARGCSGGGVDDPGQPGRPQDVGGVACGGKVRQETRQAASGQESTEEEIPDGGVERSDGRGDAVALIAKAVTDAQGHRHGDDGRFSGGIAAVSEMPKTEAAVLEVASTLRREVVSEFKTARNRCVAASHALFALYPEAELWDGTIPGDWEEGGEHTIAKIGDYFVDVTGDQFGLPEINVFTQEDIDEGYQSEYENFSRRRGEEDAARASGRTSRFVERLACRLQKQESPTGKSIPAPIIKMTRDRAGRLHGPDGKFLSPGSRAGKVAGDHADAAEELEREATGESVESEPASGEPASGEPASGEPVASETTDDERAREEYARLGVRAPAFKAWFGDSKVVDSEGEPKETHAIGTDSKPLVVFHGTLRHFDAFKTGTKNAWSDSLGFDTYFFSDNRATASTYKNQGEGGRIVEAYLRIEKPLVIRAKGGEWIDAISEAVDNIRTYRTPEEKHYLEVHTAYFEKHGYAAEYEPETIPAEETKTVEDAARVLQDHILANKKLYQEAKRKPFGYDGIIVHDVMDSTAAEPDVDEETGTYNPFSTVYVAFEPTQIKAVANIGHFSPTDPNINKSLPPALMRWKEFRSQDHPRSHDGRFATHGADAAAAAGESTAADDPDPAARLRTDAMTKVDRWLTTSGTPADRRPAYRDAMRAVLHSMPTAALERFHAHVGDIHFKDGIDAVTDAYEGVAGSRPAGKVGGFWLSFPDGGKGWLVMDGGKDTGEKYDTRSAAVRAGVASPHADRRPHSPDTTREIYGHECGHAIDGPNYEFSASSEWVEAWTREVARSDFPLSRYGASSAREGFAEFARLVWFDHERAKSVFPNCFSFWQTRGLC